MTIRDDNFLARWAQRKAEVAKAEVTVQETPAKAEACEIPEAAEPFDLAALPSLDDLTASTDIRPFMNALVPESLRNAALRRVWELDIAIRDYVSPATEYAWDWNQLGGAQGYGPLEAGYKAYEIAEKMFSQKIEQETGDESLVASGDGPLPGSGPAPANGSAEPVLRAPEQPSPKEPLPEIQTMRLSTKTDTVSNTSPDTESVATDSAEPVAQNSNYLALQHSAARHGRATPR